MALWLKSQKGVLLNLDGYQKVVKRQFTDWQTNQEVWNVVAERFVRGEAEDLIDSEVVAVAPSAADAEVIVQRISEKLAAGASLLDLNQTW